MQNIFLNVMNSLRGSASTADEGGRVTLFSAEGDAATAIWPINGGALNGEKPAADASRVQSLSAPAALDAGYEAHVQAAYAAAAALTGNADRADLLLSAVRDRLNHIALDSSVKLTAAYSVGAVETLTNELLECVDALRKLRSIHDTEVVRHAVVADSARRLHLHNTAAAG